MPSRKPAGPDLLDLLADLDKPQAIVVEPEPVDYCEHTAWEQMTTGGARFRNKQWVHAACLRPFRPPMRHR